jgi:hypothetical protein
MLTLSLSAIAAVAGAMIFRLRKNSGRRLLWQRAQPYRPERHYMRGPGPKWHAKHAGLPDERH